MKKALTLLFCICILLVNISVCTAEEDSDLQVDTFEGITFEYPADWTGGEFEDSYVIVPVDDGSVYMMFIVTKDLHMTLSDGISFVKPFLSHYADEMLSSISGNDETGTSDAYTIADGSEIYMGMVSDLEEQKAIFVLTHAVDNDLVMVVLTSEIDAFDAAYVNAIESIFISMRHEESEERTE